MMVPDVRSHMELRPRFAVTQKTRNNFGKQGGF